MVGITDKMNRFEKSFLILRERPVYPRPSIPPDALQETALPFPGGHKADGTGVGPRNGIAAAAIRQVKQLRKIIRAEQHRTARRTALRLA